ncbi:MAG: SDR family oxidoreductase [Hyphomonadaceae bacterium]|nr:SDR family oxidoreductase [Hyphomonadaceae bacterium]
MKNLFSVEGKTAVVTGGSSGIGAMMARGFLENGAKKVYITARKVERLVAMAKTLSEFGEIKAIPGDLSTIQGITDFVDGIKAGEDGIDILINNAGANWAAPVEQYPEHGWDKVMNINAKGVFYMTQACLPLLNRGTAEDPARVVIISSINGLRHPRMVNYAYSASKAAAAHMTTHLAVDLAPRRINVNGIAPGYFPTNMTKGIAENKQLEDFALRQIPLRRSGTAEDIAGTALYLCSRAGAFVCGHTVVLDGGTIAQ